MKGTNVLRLNEATVRQAIEEHLARTLLPGQRVVGIINTCSRGLDYEYEVTIETVAEAGLGSEPASA